MWYVIQQNNDLQVDWQDKSTSSFKVGRSANQNQDNSNLK